MIRSKHGSEAVQEPATRDGESSYGRIDIPPFYRRAGASPEATRTDSRRAGLQRAVEWRLLVAGLVLGDMLCLVGAAMAAGFVGSEGAFLSSSGGAPAEWGGVVGLYVVLFWVLGWHTGIYKRDNLLGGPTEYECVFRTAVYVAVAERVASYLLRLPSLPRAWWVAELAFACLFVALARFALRRVAYALRRRGLFTIRVLIAGANDQGVAIARQLLRSRHSGFRVAGFVDDYIAAGTPVALGDSRTSTGADEAGDVDVLPALGSTNQLADLVADVGIEELIVVPHAISWDGLQSIVATHSGADSGLKVHLSASLYDLVTANMAPTKRAMVPLLTLGSKRLTGLDAVLKALFDRGLAGLLFAGLWPVASLLVLFGWSKGVRPALEWRSVVGQGGRLVRVPLLREAVTGVLLLRGMPALLAVLTGRLSLVGPRPIDENEVSSCGKWVPLLAAMRPGLTGYWRLLPRDAMAEAVAAWDLWYLRNYTIWTDLFLLFKTGSAAIRRTGAGTGGVTRRWESARARAKPAGLAMSTMEKGVGTHGR